MGTARQESDHLPAEFQAFIEQAPFLILATSGADGQCSRAVQQSKLWCAA